MGRFDEIGIHDDGVQLQFFSEWQDLRLPRIDNGEIASVDFKNIDPLIGALINEKQATLKELKEDYTLEDAFLMWECIIVKKTNEYLAHKHAEKKAKK